MTIQNGFASVNDLTWHYGAAGAEDAPLMIFLHGYPAYWGMWRGMLTAFADTHRCVAPDLTGYNLSSKPQDLARYRTARLVEDLKAFAALFAKRRPFVLVGHDWGGALAWALAIKHPELLERLVIINAVHPAAFQREIARNPAQAAASQYINALRAPDAEAHFSADDYAAMWRTFEIVESQGCISPEEKAGYIAAWAQPGALTGMLNWYRAMRMAPPKAGASELPPPVYDEQAMTVRVRTLVLWGLQDRALLPGCVEGLEQWVPDLTLKTYADYGHWICLENPGTVIGAMKEWFCAPQPSLQTGAA
jgi:pimeloyl-ACP methyl ester carboxylesterase